MAGDGIERRTLADGKTKVYRVPWREGGTRDGARRSKQFSRHADAVTFRALLIANGYHAPAWPPGAAVPAKKATAELVPQLAAGASVPGPGFVDFGRRHIAALTGIGEGHRTRLLRDLELHMAPMLDRPVGELDDLRVREWVRGFETGTHPWLAGPCRRCRAMDTMRGAPSGSVRCASCGTDRPVRPRSATTIRRLLVQAGAIQEAAVIDGHAARNPFRRVKVGRRDRDEREEMVCLTHAEWQLLRDCLPEGLPRDLATVLVGTGLRWGEVTALRVQDVDVLAAPAALTVAQAWKDDGQGGYYLGPPKSRKSRRRIDFGPSTVEGFVGHVMGKQLDELVFTTQRGRPIRHSNFYNRIWQPALDRAVARGLRRRPRLHDLRHTHASWLIADGVSVHRVQQRLGHESITTTERYLHVLPVADSGDVAVLERAMGR